MPGWALAGNTPFQYFKQIVHRGGIQDAMVVHWPDGIQGQGREYVNQYCHITDIAPTILDVTGTEFQERDRRGIRQMSMDGVSSGSIPSMMLTHRRNTRSSTMSCSATGLIYQDGWKAVTIHGGSYAVGASTALHPFEDDVWELYNLQEDFSESNNLADEYPEKAGRS